MLPSSARIGFVLPKMRCSFFLCSILTPSSKDRELNNKIRSALYLARTSYGTDIHLCYLG